MQMTNTRCTTYEAIETGANGARTGGGGGNHVNNNEPPMNHICHLLPHSPRGVLRTVARESAQHGTIPEEHGGFSVYHRQQCSVR